MRPVKLEDLKKGDLILVKWFDASDIRGSLTEHQSKPEVHVKDWGVFLGISGRLHQFVIIGKDVSEVHQDWGATRIPLDLVEEIVLIMPHNEVAKFIAEVQVLGPRRIRLRKYRREVIKPV